MDCRTLPNGQLLCNDPCKGDICAIWFYRVMSTDQIRQGCLVGSDLRGESSPPMGCLKNRVDAFLCLCNSTDFCNANNNKIISEYSTNNSFQLSPSNNIQCHSRTSASFIRQQIVKPLRNSCISDLCFFIELNITRKSLIESTISRNCGSEAQFNFHLLLGKVWPGTGLRSNACYRIDIGEQIITGCTCTKNNCNNQIPFPINNDSNLLVKCSTSTNSNCFGHFCFIQREIWQGYGQHWTRGCLSMNESETYSKFKVGYRNILGSEQWICNTNLCNKDLQLKINKNERNNELIQSQNYTKKRRKKIINYSTKLNSKLDIFIFLLTVIFVFCYC
uniref:DUF7622 domain-containing protein n=1 Tax=Meloidogyne incognita TaxID=6306 RepID=A0A914KYW7_MELIC